MRFNNYELHNNTDKRRKHHFQPALAQTAPTAHHKMDSWSFTAFTKLPRIYDGKGHTRAHRQLRTSGTDFMVQAPSNTPQKRTQHLPQNWQNKTPKAHQLQERLMTKYLDGLPQDTKPLRSCPGNRTTMINKCQSRKIRGAQEEQQRAQITILRHFWHHMIQIALTIIHHDLLWPIREKLLRTDRTVPLMPRAEIEKKVTGGWHWKKLHEVHFDNPSLLPTYQYTL